ncbi:hypothetical protein CDN99_17265 [Roseateles aquatilis]|uniref:HTH gntR-type domain-containing protein n=1 Tax=Roseateles aquatilis TaxID=431061 RepID=A0A246J7I3_9BURK|nr:GntR family transcriptional regulator [Roseateles aquatilis]OWQ88593.1 hypothetical protein CDN99_17265 [Roseateles aquatilis]
MVRPLYPINAPTYLRLRDQIRADIEGGCWRLGQHLTLNELSAHYSVSNVPVREALLQLQGDGMVDMRMNRGAVVLDVNERFIDEYFDIREALQSMLMTRACQRRGGGVLMQAKVLLGRVDEAMREGKVRQLLEADHALQDAIGHMGDNEPAMAMLASRSRLLEAFRRARLDLLTADLMQLPVQGLAMLLAIEHGDPGSGCEAVRRHVAAMRAYMKKLLKIPEGRSRADASLVNVPTFTRARESTAAMPEASSTEPASPAVASPGPPTVLPLSLPPGRRLDPEGDGSNDNRSTDDGLHPPKR